MRSIYPTAARRRRPSEPGPIGNVDLRHPMLRIAAVVCAALLWTTGVARAEIRGFRGRVEASVQGIDNGQPGSFDSNSDTYALTNDPQPLSAGARLQTDDLTGLPIAEARSLTFLFDPRSAGRGNPGEFALELGAFSNDAAQAFQLVGTASEARVVRFSLPELIAQRPNLTTGSEQRLVSRVWLSGALVFWSSTPDGGLTGVDAELTVSIRDSRAPEDAPAMQLRRRFQGTETGQVIQTESSEVGFTLAAPITVRNLADLRREAEGIGAAAQSARDLVDQADQLGIGTFVVVLIPTQRVVYTYPLELDTDFELKADFELRLRSGPNGTGVAGVMGRPFAGLGDLFAASVRGAEGGLFQKSVNMLISEASASSAATGSTPPAFTSPGLCGAFGIETPALGLLSMVGLGFVTARSRRRSTGART